LGACAEREPVASRRLALTGGGFALFARNAITIETQVRVEGAVAVRDGTGATELSIGPHAAIEGDLLADTIAIASHAHVTGSVTGNSLQIHKTATLSQPPSSPLALPLADVTPAVPGANPGTEDMTVASGSTVALGPGAYRAVVVRQGAATRLHLAGGRYDLQSLTVEQHAHLACLSACELAIAGSLIVAQHATFGPVAGRSAAEVTVVVDGSSTHAASVAQHAAVTGRLVARQSDVELGAHATARGQVIGLAITLGAHASVTVEAPFGPPSGDAGVSVDAGVPDAPRPDAPVADLAAPDAPRPDTPLPDAPLPDTSSCTTIGSAGGTVTSADGRAILEVPAGALSAAVCLRVLPASAPPSGAIGSAYTVDPAGTSFAQPATMRLLYDPNALGGVAEATLALAKVSGSAWQILAGGVVDAGNDRVSAPIAESGSFGILPSVCGDGVVSGTEGCDGSVPPGVSCQSMGYVGGTIACTTCAIDTSGCVSCAPATCASLGQNCGAVPDGCGGTLDCGTCASPQTCGGGGVPNVCGCTPTTCGAQGKDCGSISDGCGGGLECGTCTPPQSCGGGGVPNVCGCTPTTCAAQLASCGTVPDGCGGTLGCGSCTLPQTCGGGGVPNACGCTPTTCAAQGATCGSIPDGCGGSLECGSCTLPQTCGGGGTANQCGCTPTTCATQGKDCGTIADGCGGTLDCGSCGAGLLCGWGGAPNVCGAAYPPDPAAVAPPIQEAVATTIVDGYGFLYQGASPIQINVAPTAIDVVRAAVVRGRVLDAAGAPRPGVTVAILGQPGLGHTLTRVDGRFDLVVNGGAPIVLRFAAAGLLAAQRQVSVLWQDQVTLDDVVLIAPDPEVTTILSGSAAMQVARGSISSDASGNRQATLLFPASTSATMTLPDGSTQPLPTMSVRATEFTVGTLGPKRMPAALPPNVAYTYALEIGADEAIAADAPQVSFSIPLVLYVENFLGFPVGGAVPLGSYHRQRGVWVPEPSGRIVRVLSVTAGLADLDLDGSGLPADAAALSSLGVTDDERAHLATIYVAGQSLWRMPIAHFTNPWDANWPWGGPTPAGPGAAPYGAPPDPPTTCTWPIECQTQTLQDRAPVTGTPFTLHYRSDRVPGTLEIPLTSATPPLGLLAVELEVHVAGRVIKQSFGPAPSQTASFSWDNLDAYGRPVRGKQPAKVRLGYVLPGQYTSGTSFGAPGGAPIGGLREPRIYWFYSNLLLGHLDTPRSDLGGWRLSAVHGYDPIGRDLYLGDGRKQRGDETFSHAVSPVYQRGLSTDVATDGEGNLYMSLAIPAIAGGSQIVMKRSPSGAITRVAGLEGLSGFSGDGGPAVDARLSLPMSVAVDGSGNLFVADRGNARVRRVDKATGIITTVAGGGSGVAEGGLATNAAIAPYRIAVDRHGTLYIADRVSHRIRRVDANGRIWTAAGTGVDGNTGDGGPATSAQISRPTDVEVDDRGQIYFIASYRIRKVGPDGIVTTIASHHTGCSMADGVPLAQACILPLGLTVDRSGDLHYTDSSISAGSLRSRVRKVNPDGTVVTIGGNGLLSAAATPGIPAMLADFCPGQIAFAPDGTIYSAAESSDIVNSWGCWDGFFRVAPVMPGFSASEIAVPSSDGRELYRFSPSGRHLETKNALTGATLATIGYTADGKLSTVTDADGNVTTVQRDAAGAATAIVGPYGQSTALALDGNGWLSQITNPAGESKRLAYTPGGLMTSMTTPRGHVYAFEYGKYGRIVKHTGPDTAEKTLALTRTSADVYTVSVTSGEGKTTVYGVEGIAGGAVRQQNTFPTGLANDSTFGADATSSVTLADGTVATQSLAPDPRWHLIAPYTNAATTRMPSGLTSSASASRTATLGDPSNLLSLTTATDTFTQNGRTTTTAYTASTRLETTTSPMGRVTRRWIDPQGRTTRVEAPGVAPVEYAWDAQGRLSTVTQGTAPDARVTTMTYNPQGYLATVTDPLSRLSSFQYDLAGRVTQQQLPGGRTVLMGYDPNGNLTSITPPGRSAHLFGFTPVDETASYTPPDLGLGSPTTSYQYNLDRQLSNVTRPDGQTIVMGYDTAGRLETVTTPTGVTTYTYSPTTGSLSGISAPGGVGLAYTWDGSLPTGTSWSGPVAGSVTRTYNTDFDVASITVAGTPFSFTRDNDRLLTGAGAMTITRDATTGFVTGTTLGSVTTGRTYSSFGELATTSASYSGSPLFATSYTRDALGRITELVETVQGATSTWGYEYNAAGQLWKVRLDGTQVAEYQYDLNGNRLSATDELGVPTYGSYDAQDRLTSYGTATYAYTLNGELQSKTVPGVGTTTYSYDVLGNLRGATLPDGTAIEYLIDGMNRRIGKKVNGTLVQGFLWDDQLRVVAELDGAGAVVSRFVYGQGLNVPEYVIKGGNTYRIVTDHLGSPRLVVDVSTGTVAQRIDYDEWGVIVNDSSPGFQPFGFGGGLYDRDTKLVRFGARDYDAEVSRWTAKDPIRFDGGDNNLFAYVLGDPINSCDASGMSLADCICPRPGTWPGTGAAGPLGMALGAGMAALAVIHRIWPKICELDHRDVEPGDDCPYRPKPKPVCVYRCHFVGEPPGNFWVEVKPGTPPEGSCKGSYVGIGKP
jgi:RHS repeat-associated protein